MITKDLPILARFLQEIDGASLGSIEGRIAFQKKVYLLYVAGVDLGYRFEWDLYGPYSPGLATSGARYEEEKGQIDAIAGKLKLTATATEAATRVKRAMQRAEGAPGLTETGWLELMCSLHFISETNRVDLSNVELLSKELVRLKPFFASYEDQISVALERVSELADPQPG